MNDNLKMVAKFGIQFGENVANVLEDSKISAGEAFSFLPILMSVPGILEKKAEIKAEWEGRTTESMQDLNLYIQTELSLPNKPLEAKIEKGVTAVLAVLDLVAEFQKPATDAPPIEG